MNHPSTPPSKHNVPAIFIVAAVVLILFCGVGIAALMGWLPSSDRGGRPDTLVTPPAEQLATAPAAPATTLQSSQYAAGAGSVNGVPTGQLPVTSGASVGGSSGGGGVIAAPAVPAEPTRVTASKDTAAQRERDRQRAEERREQKRAAACRNCGVVESVEETKTRAQGSGLGAAGGAVVGGLLGRQVGDGRGRDLATIAGAVGGAVVGNQVEGNMKATKRYTVTVRMHDGELRTFNTDAAVWRGGDQVKVVEGQLQSR